MRVTELSFKAGHELKIRIKPDDDSAGFAVNIGHDPENIALHINPRFDSCGDTNVIVINHCSGGSWGQEERDSHFCFVRGEECKFYISLTNDGFDIKLSDGNVITFPNRLGDVKYNHFEVSGDAVVCGFKLKSS